MPFLNDNVAEKSRVGLVNSFVPSLLKATDIKIGSENVTKEVDNYYRYKCLLDIIFSGKMDKRKKELESLLYAKVLDPFM